jgi:YidC/Oxa1 family membrane protein insertase
MWTEGERTPQGDSQGEIALEQGPQAGEPGAGQPASPGLPEAPAAAPPAPDAPGAGPEAEVGEVAEALAVERIEIERPLFHATLSSKGAALERWELIEYDDRYGARIQLVPAHADALPLATTPLVELGIGDLSRAIWEVESRTENGVVFAKERDGIRLRKTYSFEPDGYSFRLAVDLENRSSRSVSPRFLLDWPAEVRPEQDFVEQSLAALHEGSVALQPLAGIGSPGFFGGLVGRGPVQEYEVMSGGIDWVAYQTTYFLSAAFPDSPSQARARFAVLEPSQRGVAQLFFDPVEVPPGQSVSRVFRGYLGPKEPEQLAALGNSAEASIDLGWSWVAPLTRMFSWLLHALYSLIPNYGVAIILLTILVRAVTAPLTVRQMRSMERLRRVQPKMKEIQEKYADDRQKQSEELMKLYRQEKVNPLGGCFPMVLQLPVFIGLFYALRSSIDLRHAPFFGWIDDLSAPDELFTIPGVGLPVRVLPIIMGATMFLQQKITPMQTPDPMQARMMMIVMPIMMTVLFYQFPSGLVLYWMLSNVLAILHQLWIGRNMPPVGRAEQPASA